MDKRLYWIWLQQAVGYGSFQVHKALEQIADPKEIYLLTYGERKALCVFHPKELDRLEQTPLSVAEKILSDCEKLDCHILCYDDPHYPKLLREIDSPPLVLYYKGSVKELNSQLVISMVGTRKMSEYGSKAAYDISYQLAQAGCIIVSGMAVGIDTQCHKGALKAAGKTVAVLGTGIESDYPLQNRQLRERIENNGAVITEYAPFSHVTKFTFPLRNRIIAGLSVGVLVVEAGEKSGSLITAGQGLTHGRDIFVIPNTIYASGGKGTFQLLRQGAIPVSSGRDILEEYLDVYRDKIVMPEQTEVQEIQIEPPKEIPKLKAQPPSYLSPQQANVFLCLAEEETDVETLMMKSNMTMYELLSVLTELEIYGVVQAKPGRRFTLTTKI